MGKNSTKENNKNKSLKINNKNITSPSQKTIDFIISYSKVTRSVLKNKDLICLN